jgi:aspartate/methionine/tyrosine aminotransferase
MFDPVAREPVRAIPASRIREVANSAMGAPDVLAFWFGEPDRPTPKFIVEAAKAALDAGDTFYLPNLGAPRLRAALAEYVARWHRPVGAQRIAVASSGVNALMLAAQAVVSPGDRVVAVTPLWPNLTAIAQVLGARVDAFPLEVDPVRGRWRLDVERLLAVLTPDTRMLMVNSPGNPTGWVITPDEQRLLLEHCRRYGIWVLADEAYERLVFDGSECAPSFLDCADERDRLIVANTFSKTWQMTGWRLGWLVLPPSLVPDVEKLIEFNTSCAPGFVQQAGLAALQDGDDATRSFAAYVRDGTRALVDGLRAVNRVEAVEPDGAMYVLLRIDGATDSLALAKSLVAEARLGLAPGIAFGPECEGYLRWCTARPAQTLRQGIERLDAYLRRRG